MGKYYCDYCDVYLTHDSPAVRKQHNDGNRHKQSVCDYYREFVGKRTQKEIDEVVANFEHKVAMGLVVPTFGFAEAPVKVLPTQPPAPGVNGDVPPPSHGMSQPPPPASENDLSTMGGNPPPPPSDGRPHSNGLSNETPRGETQVASADQ